MGCNSNWRTEWTGKRGESEEFLVGNLGKSKGNGDVDRPEVCLRWIKWEGRSARRFF